MPEEMEMPLFKAIEAVQLRKCIAVDNFFSYWFKNWLGAASLIGCKERGEGKWLRMGTKTTLTMNFDLFFTLKACFLFREVLSETSILQYGQELES